MQNHLKCRNVSPKASTRQRQTATECLVRVRVQVKLADIVFNFCLLVSYSTEVYFTHGPVEEQLVWLTNDLKEANKPENRAKRPWIIAFGHRPMYCSNIDNDDCTTLHSVVRKR